MSSQSDSRTLPETFARHFSHVVDFENLTLALEVVATCSLRCLGCWVAMARPGMWEARPTEIMAPGLVDAALTFGRKVGATRLTLLGGEPTMHPDLPSIIRKATGKGYHASITTNGVCPPAHLITILASGLSAISFSLDGSTPEIHDTLRPSANGRSTFYRTVESIRQAVFSRAKWRYTVCVNHTIFPRNLHDTEAMIRFAASLGVDHVRLHFTLPGDYPEPDGKITYLDPARWLALRDHLPSLARELGVPISAASGYGQAAVAAAQQRKSPYLTVQPDGNVLLCAAYARLSKRETQPVGRLVPDDQIVLNPRFARGNETENYRCCGIILRLLTELPTAVREVIEQAGGIGCIILTGLLVRPVLPSAPHLSEPTGNPGLQTERASIRLVGQAEGLSDRETHPTGLSTGLV